MPKTDTSTITKLHTAHVLIVALATLLLLALSVLFAVRVDAAAATFTVTNTNDSGSGSLRQAIIDANSNNNPADMDVIEFDIAGSGVHTITPQTQLPDIDEKVTIDGYTQPGAQVNTATTPLPLNNVIKLEISGSSVNDETTGLNITADEVEIRGLSIYGFGKGNTNWAAIVSAENQNVKIQGNYINVQSDGMTRAPGRIDQGIIGLSSDSGMTIGGTNPEDRNIMVAFSNEAASAAIAYCGSNGEIYGNYVGLARDGVTDLTPEESFPDGISPPFGTGIGFCGDYGTSGSNIAGGPNEGMKNVISGNALNIQTNVTNNVIQGNYIGTDYTGSVNPEITNGIGVGLLVNAEDNLVGGIAEGEGNIIAGVVGSGVMVAEFEFLNLMTITPAKNAILGNKIYAIKPFNFTQFGSANLAIDHLHWTDTNLDFIPDESEDRGPTPNDPGDSDTGPNGYINTPILKSAQQVGNELTITYDLDAADSPSNSYRVEFFANDESTIFGTGPAQTYLGAATGVTPGTNKTITLTVNDDYADQALSATTTAIDNSTASGFGSTSELARNISIGSQFDRDADGIPDSTEDLGPNNGDGNNDGIPDRLQPTVTTYEIDSTGIYATLVTDGCSENGTVSSLDFTSLNTTDTGYDYPYGLTDFTLNCSRGDTVDVTMYIHTESNPNQYVPRKYNPTSETFFAIPDSTLTSEPIGDGTALKLTYSITDGGDLDDDATENGIIVDPVGIATLTSTTQTPDPQFEGVGAPNTGIGRHWLLGLR